MFWMTERVRYHITFPAFVSLFRLGDNDINYPKLHDEGVLESKEMHFMYTQNCRRDWGKMKSLYTFYSILNQLFRKTLTPRDGNTSDVTLFQRDLMAAMRPGSPQFSVGDFIWQEIKNVSENPQKICSCSPYIMYMIKKTTGINFPSDVIHKPMRPPVSKTPRIPSPPAAAEAEEEIQHEHYQQPDTQTGAGLTGSRDRSDRFRSGQHNHSHRNTYSHPPLGDIKVLPGSSGVKCMINLVEDDSNEETPQVSPKAVPKVMTEIPAPQASQEGDILLAASDAPPSPAKVVSPVVFETARENVFSGAAALEGEGVSARFIELGKSLAVPHLRFEGPDVDPYDSFLHYLLKVDIANLMIELGGLIGGPLGAEGDAGAATSPRAGGSLTEPEYFDFKEFGKNLAAYGAESLGCVATFLSLKSLMANKALAEKAKDQEAELIEAMDAPNIAESSGAGSAGDANDDDSKIPSESLRDYTKRYFTNRNMITDVDDRDVINYFHQGLHNIDLWRKMFESNPKTISEMMVVVNKHADMEDAEGAPSPQGPASLRRPA
ncbi:uncharacterized protein C2845_PM15G02300 [Panicum miliaceum]|uniref:Uncharacterized protein n=1 Tax=Panicum miliaceum TaxID=4540 RepID=A0A3L6Q8L8_PANMI|nr:uncharacterized protein C2845_PM15G02300 [Panicum miliaceum]